MGVDSIVEMYSILWAWNQYEVLWNLLKSTGLAFLPFFGLVFNNLITTLQSQDPGDASTASMKGIQIDIITALVVVLVAVEPTIPLELNKVEYVKICFHDSQDPDKTFNKKYRIEQGTAGEKENIYNRISMQGFETVKIPAWWFAVLSFSNGVVKAGQEALPCIEDLRTNVNAIDRQKITSPLLLRQLAQFTENCYKPAKAIYRRHTQSGFPQGVDFQDLAARNEMVYKGQDLEWIGSSILVRTEHYYERLLLTKDLYTDDDFVYPISCKDAWVHPTNGLRDRLIIQIRRNVPGAHDRSKKMIKNAIDHAIKNASGGQVPDNKLFQPSIPMPKLGQYVRSFRDLTAEEREDLTLYLMLKNFLGNNMAFHTPSDAVAPSSFSNSFANGYSEAALAIGLPYQKMKHFNMVDTIIKTIPISGALILLGLIMFLPVGFVLSSYSVKYVVIASIGLFSIKFFYYLWHVAWWLDQNFMHLLYFEGVVFADKQADIIDIVASSMYIGFPMLWALIMTWAGFTVSQHISGGAEEGAKPMIQGGEQVLSTGTRMALQKAGNVLSDKALYPDRDKKAAERAQKEKDKEQLIDDLSKETEDFEEKNETLKTSIKEAEQERDQFEIDLQQTSEHLEKARLENDLLRERLNAVSQYAADDDFYMPIPDETSDNDKKDK